MDLMGVGGLMSGNLCLRKEQGYKLLLQGMSVQQWSRSSSLSMGETPSYSLLVDD